MHVDRREGEHELASGLAIDHPEPAREEGWAIGPKDPSGQCRTAALGCRSATGTWDLEAMPCAPVHPGSAGCRLAVMEAAPHVLVCYASAAGSTRGIAERIADRIRTELRERWRVAPEVLCRPTGPDLRPADADALIVGSAVHNMAWLPEATSLLDRAVRTPAPVWVFSVGSVEPRGLVTRMLADRERSRVERAFPVGFRPRDHRVFRGIVVMTGIPLWARLFWRLMGGRPGDHRNWASIDSWATGIATELAASLGAAPSADHL